MARLPGYRPHGRVTHVTDRRRRPTVNRPWEADPGARVRRRLGSSAADLGYTKTTKTCPDILELDNGDVAIVGRDMTDALAGTLPPDVNIGDDERLVVIPRGMLIAAKPDIPDA
jgi:hypothetical protein